MTKKYKSYKLKDLTGKSLAFAELLSEKFGEPGINYIISSTKALKATKPTIHKWIDNGGVKDASYKHVLDLGINPETLERL